MTRSQIPETWEEAGSSTSEKINPLIMDLCSRDGIWWARADPNHESSESLGPKVLKHIYLWRLFLWKINCTIRLACGVVLVQELLRQKNRQTINKKARPSIGWSRGSLLRAGWGNIFLNPFPAFGSPEEGRDLHYLADSFDRLWVLLRTYNKQTGLLPNEQLTYCEGYESLTTPAHSTLLNQKMWVFLSALKEVLEL